MKRKNVDDLSLAPEINTLRAERDKVSEMLYAVLRQVSVIQNEEDEYATTLDLDKMLSKIPGASKWWADMRKKNAVREKQEAVDKAAAIAAVKADIEAAQAKLDKLTGVTRPQPKERKPIVTYPMFKAGDAVWYYAKVNGPGVRGKVVRRVKMKGKPPHDWGYSIDTVGGKRLTDKADVTQLTSRTGNGLVDRDA